MISSRNAHCATGCATGGFGHRGREGAADEAQRTCASASAAAGVLVGGSLPGRQGCRFRCGRGCGGWPACCGPDDARSVRVRWTGSTANVAHRWPARNLVQHRMSTSLSCRPDSGCPLYDSNIVCKTCRSVTASTWTGPASSHAGWATSRTPGKIGGGNGIGRGTFHHVSLRDSLLQLTWPPASVAVTLSEMGRLARVEKSP